jgi:DNA replication protein DnaC
MRVHDSEKVGEFVSSEERGLHFVIMGQKRSGKTTISVGMGNELSIQHNRTTYTTLTKWVSTLDESDEQLLKGERSLWSWRQADFLIIDDINPGSPEEANLYSASNIYEILYNSKCQEENRQALNVKSVAWVVGSCSCDENENSWIQMLENIGIVRDKIIVINLNKDS